MMYKLSETRINIERFKSFNIDLVIKNKQKEIYLNTNHLISTEVDDIFILDNYLLYNKVSSCHIYNLLSNLTTCKENQFALNLKTNTNNRWLFTDIATNLLLFENNFSFDNERLLIKNYDWEFLFLATDCLYLHNSKNLKSLSLLTGEYEWEVALNRHGEILKIFGVVDNTLVVCWHRGHRTFGLLGIDLASGQIRWNMDNNQLLDGRTAQLSDGNLFSTSAYGDESYYIELDIRTQQVLRYGEIPHLKSLGLRIRWINWQDNLLYFTAFYQDSFGAEAIGVLDKNSLDLLWWERVSLEKGAFLVNEAPQVAGNKLYVLDSGGTLHIFEREEGNLSSPQQQ